MAGNSLGLRHLHKEKKDNLTFKKSFDKFVYLIVFLVPLAHLPQIIKIWFHKDASGISLISWSSFFLFSLFWLTYGIIHREKPLIFMNGLLLVMQSIILIGGYLYNS